MLSRSPLGRRVTLFTHGSKVFSTNVSPNHELLQMLSRNLDHEASSPTRNVYKVRAFARAIEVIGALQHPVRSVDEVKKLKGVGIGISNRIDAFLSGKDYCPEASGSLKTRKKADTDEERKKLMIQSLSSVSNIGARTAAAFVEAGCESIADLMKPKYFDTLNGSQQIGVRYHEHLKRPVERSQAEQLLTFISENISCKFDIELVGSYRRGAQTLAGVDVLLTHPSHVHIPTPPPPSSLARGGTKSPFRMQYTKLREVQDTLLLHDVVLPLENRGLIAETLFAGCRKWQGVIRLPEVATDGVWEERSERIEHIREQQGLYMRLDLSLAPVKSKGAALLALTGDKEFNADIHKKAERLGLFLNEFGLWRWISDTPLLEDANSSTSAKGYWSFTEGESEAAVLRELDMGYVEPLKRNFAYLTNSNTNPSVVKKKGRPRKNVA